MGGFDTHIHLSIHNSFFKEFSMSTFKIFHFHIIFITPFFLLQQKIGRKNKISRKIN